MPTPIKLALRVFLSAGILYLLLANVDADDLGRTISDVNLYWYLLSLLAATAAAGIISLKYYLLARGTAVDAPLLRVIEINFISRFFGLVIPSGAGQGVVRWYKMTKNRDGKAYYLAVTVFERLVFLMTGFVLVVAPLYLLELPESVVQLRERLAPALGLAGLALVLAIAALRSPAWKQSVARLLNRLAGAKGRNAGAIFTALDISALPRRRVCATVALSVVWQALYVLRVYLLLWSLQQPLPLFQVAWISSLVFLLQVLPLSIAGLGVREGAYVYILSLYGLPENLGFALGLLFFTHMLVFAAIGGILNVTEGLTQTQG